ncbi:hypothetical protein PROVRUST_08494, partial [Providencia rustigianii DSM 4541]
AAGDVGAYTKAETDTKVADAKKAGTDAQATANAANTAATNANNNANGRVPSTRKVNNKPLSADISLTAGDVGTYTKSEIDSKILASVNNKVFRVSAPTEVGMGISGWSSFSTDQFIVGMRNKNGGPGDVWCDRLKIASLQIMVNGVWVNVTN